MRILACNEHYGFVGGAEVYLLDSVSRLEAMGHEVGVLHDTPAGESLEGARPAFRVPGMLGFLHSGSQEMLRRVREAADRFSPDLIYIFQVLNPAVIRALAERAPAIRYVLGLRLTCPTGRRMPRTWDGICDKPFDALCLWKAHTQLCMPRRPDTALKVWTDVRRNQRASTKLHRLLLPSRYVRDVLIRCGMEPDRLEVLHLYTDLDPRAEANVPSADRRILVIGRPTPEKGFQCVIEALSHIQAPTTLEVIGEGPFLEELRLLAEQAPSQHTVLFSGHLPRERIGEAFQRARVCAVPSVWPEPFGLVGIEAMAHGIPTVGFDVGGIPDWLRDDVTGKLAPRKDIPALAHALETYLADRTLARGHGTAGREEVRRRFLPKHHFTRLARVFEEAVAGRARLDTYRRRTP